MTSSILTTIQLHTPLFRFLYSIGLSPIKFPVHTEVPSVTIEEFKENLHLKPLHASVSVPEIQKNTLKLKNAKWVFWIVFSLCLIQFGFAAFQLIRILSEGMSKSSPSTVFAASCWVVYSISACLIYLVHILKFEEINKFLQCWSRIEQEIFMDYYFDQEEKREMGGFLESSFYKRQRFANSLFSITAAASLSLMVLNLILFPRFPMYIYSLVPQDQEICWMRGLSAIAGMMCVILFILSEVQAEILFPAFARSVNHCIEILMDPNEISGKYNNTCPKTQKITVENFFRNTGLSEFEYSMERYEKLNDLIKKFNQIFSWPIILYKMFALIKMCCYAFIVLKHTDANQPTGIWGYLVFPYALISLMSKVGIIVTCFGAVERQTGLFLKYWKRIVYQLDPESRLSVMLERRLKSCTKFGFTCGNFYTVYPHTILTFYSVTLTYLIIMLQL